LVSKGGKTVDESRVGLSLCSLACPLRSFFIFVYLIIRKSFILCHLDRYIL
jgi:hypothetical protein